MQDAQRPREITGKACLFQQSIGQIRKKARLMKFGLEISAGTIGQVLLAVFSILINMLGYLYFNFMDFVWLGFLASIAFLFGSSLILVSTIDNYDDFVSVAPGTIGAIFGVISAAMLIVQFGMAPLGISYAPGYTYRYFSEYFYYPTRFGLFLRLASDFVLGLMLFAIGVFFVTQRERLTPRVLWVATGVVYLVAGLFGLSILASFVTFYLLVPAGIMGALCFAIGRPKDFRTRVG